MAFRQTDVAGAFRNNSHLQQFMLTGVTPTGRRLGTGSYGSVEEVKYGHLVCASKKLHEALVDDENIGVGNVVRKYEQECQLMSSLRHPNITQFLGLCFLPGTRLPLLVMERLETSLDDLLEHMPGLPLSLKCSVLEDVASGLVYLHERQPPVIHRDLTTNNVLLTSSLVAKISDLGNSRIADMRPGQLARTLSRLPGTLVYMPPEALNEIHRYGPSLDIFSFGHLILYTLTQVFPGNLLAPSFPNPDDPERMLGRTEVERRGEYIELLEKEIGNHHPALVQLVKQCLHNTPSRRPATDEVLNQLQRLKVEVEGVYGGNLVKLDIGRVLLAKDIKMKDKRITQLEERFEVSERRVEELVRELEISREQLQRDSREYEEQLQLKDGQLRQLQRNIEAKDGQLQQQRGDIEVKDRQLRQQQGDIEVKDRQLQQQRGDIEVKDRQLRQLQREIEVKSKHAEESLSNLRTEMEREARLREELQAKVSRLTEEPKRSQELLGSTKELLKLEFPLDLQLNWRRGPDMPFEMGGYLQSVVMQGKVYVGGSGTGYFGNRYIVMEYDIDSGKWDKLAQYRTCSFAMTAINNQLVLVGGTQSDDSHSRLLGIWRADSKKWIHPYPDMPTACHSPSVVTYKEWLVVVGGDSDMLKYLSSVNVMNTSSKQWHTVSTAPAMACMWTAVVGDICYFMGGFDNNGNTDVVYSVSLPALLSQVNSKGEKDPQIWKRISGLGLYCSTPLSIGGSLLALGGKDMKDERPVTAIHHYRPETGEWVKVGDLPSPRYDCTCARITDGEILVAGGYDGQTVFKSTELARLL